MLKIKKSNIAFNLFLMLFITASIPYLFYAINAVLHHLPSLGGLYTASIETNIIGKLFSYSKDVIAVLLLFYCLLNREKSNNILFNKFVLVSVIILIYGILVLMIDGNFDYKFILAGIRTFLFLASASIFCIKYANKLSLKQIKTLFVYNELILLFQVIFTFLEIYYSNGLTNIGKGAYRFSGLFAASGNLGCYCISTIILLSLLIKKYKLFGRKILIINCCELLFLAISSGTRTSMIVVLFISIYMIMELYGEKIRINKKIIFVILILLLIIFSPKIITFFTEITGRGSLTISGNGRFDKFINMINKSNLFELMFGRGIGVGTNASISMGIANSEVSDSTINLLFTQFGFFGLFVCTLVLISILKKIYINSKEYRYISISFIFAVCVIFVVGNLFEQISMILTFVLTYFLVQIEGDKINDKAIN